MRVSLARPHENEFSLTIRKDSRHEGCMHLISLVIECYRAIQPSALLCVYANFVFTFIDYPV
jgi:hypothetical protein